MPRDADVTVSLVLKLFSFATTTYIIVKIVMSSREQVLTIIETIRNHVLIPALQRKVSQILETFWSEKTAV